MATTILASDISGFSTEGELEIGMQDMKRLADISDTGYGWSAHRRPGVLAENFGALIQLLQPVPLACFA
jgi:hypothetical protein